MANFDSHAFCARCCEKGKGSDDCVKNPQSSDCKICSAFSEEKRLQLATPSYRIKKEKREAKKLESTPAKESEELIDPANVSVIGPVEKPTTSKSPTEAPPDKKAKKDSKKVGKKDKSPSSTVSKPPQSSTDDKIADLDSKWLERFNRLEALIMAKNFEPKFSANVKVTPTHSPPSSVEHVYEPFIRPSTSTKFPGTGFSASKHQPASQTKTSRPVSSTRFPGQGSSATTHQPTSQTKTDRPILAPDNTTDPSSQTQQGSHRPPSTARPMPSDTTDSASPTLHRSRQDSISSLSSDAGSDLLDRPPLDLYAEEGELSEDPEHSVIDQDQPVSEEQNYRDTMQGIRSYMGWTHIPEVDSFTTTAEDNPFAGPKAITPGKVSVKMPTEEWLYKKLSKLNLTLSEGYPSRGWEAGGLAKDVFLRPPHSQSKWYRLHTEQKTDSSKVGKFGYINLEVHKLWSSRRPQLVKFMKSQQIFHEH